MADQAEQGGIEDTPLPVHAKEPLLLWSPLVQLRIGYTVSWLNNYLIKVGHNVNNICRQFGDGPSEDVRHFFKMHLFNNGNGAFSQPI